MSNNKIIDFHVHIYPPEIIRDCEKISENEPYFNALIHNKVHKWAALEDLLLRMQRDNITRAIIFGFAFQDMGLCKICNDYIIDCVKKFPDKLTGLCVVPPCDKNLEREIMRCADSGLIGAGELFPDGQNINISDENQTLRLTNAIRAANFFILWHLAEPVGHEYVGKGKTSTRDAFKFCVNNPDITTIFAHFGGGLWIYELMPEVKKILSNTYYDIAAMPYLYDAKIFDAIKAAGMTHKFLMGSDYPILDSSRYEKKFNDSNLDINEIKQIKFLNAENLLSRKNKSPCK